jgi:hypothetical protein
MAMLYTKIRSLSGAYPRLSELSSIWRLHDQDQRISVGINDSILTEDLSTINEGIPMG